MTSDRLQVETGNSEQLFLNRQNRRNFERPIFLRDLKGRQI